jgi:hypothetical protein
MIGKYAFSFDRETFRGAYHSRPEALKAALEAASHETDPPATVYVACRAPLDPHAHGHAESLIQRMRRAVRSDVGPEAEAFLKSVSDQELADLDHEIERTIRCWLAKHELLLPSGKLAAISEHPVPTPSHAGSSHGNGELEVQQIGEV